MTLNLNNILAFAAIFQSLLLSIFFFQNVKGNKLSNKILSIFLGVIAVTIFFSFTKYNLVGKTLLADKYPIFYLAVEFNYLLGPLLYFYIKSLIDKNFKIRLSYLIHFIPFFITTSLVAFTLAFWYYFYFPVFLANFLVNIHFRDIDISILIVHLIGYNIACIVLVIRKKKTDDPFSKNLQNSWLSFLMLFCTILLAVRALIYIAFIISGSYDILVFSNISYFIVLFVLIYLISFYILKRPDIFSFPQKYQNSELKSSDLEEFKKRLICYIEESKIYLDPSLTITILSKKLSIPVPYLSRVINESFNLNFCDYINRYRIQESQRYLKDLPNTKKTILEIAYTVGFNSKSTFYEAFKKHTGITPTEYTKNTR